eukprot:9380981-Alexandrium_andersonii.AAC.1
MADIRATLIIARHGRSTQVQDAGPRLERGGSAVTGQCIKTRGARCFCRGCQDGHRGGGWREAREE